MHCIKHYGKNGLLYNSRRKTLHIDPKQSPYVIWWWVSMAWVKPRLLVKLAKRLQGGKKVMLATGYYVPCSSDWQLQIWGDRSWHFLLLAQGCYGADNLLRWFWCILKVRVQRHWCTYRRHHWGVYKIRPTSWKTEKKGKRVMQRLMQYTTWDYVDWRIRVQVKMPLIKFNSLTKQFGCGYYHYQAGWYSQRWYVIQYRKPYSCANSLYWCRQKIDDLRPFSAKVFRFTLFEMDKIRILGLYRA